MSRAAGYGTSSCQTLQPASWSYSFHPKPPAAAISGGPVPSTDSHAGREVEPGVDYNSILAAAMYESIVSNYSYILDTQYGLGVDKDSRVWGGQMIKPRQVAKGTGINDSESSKSTVPTEVVQNQSVFSNLVSRTITAIGEYLTPATNDRSENECVETRRWEGGWTEDEHEFYVSDEKHCRNDKIQRMPLCGIIGA